MIICKKPVSKQKLISHHFCDGSSLSSSRVTSFPAPFAVNFWPVTLLTILKIGGLNCAVAEKISVKMDAKIELSIIDTYC